MSQRYNNGSHYQNHQRAAELHQSAAHAHLTAAAHFDKQEHLTGHEHSRQALEHSQKAFHHAQQTHHEIAKELAPEHEEVAKLAYEIWQAKGCPEGSGEQDWQEATDKLTHRHLTL